MIPAESRREPSAYALRRDKRDGLKTARAESRAPRDSEWGIRAESRREPRDGL